MKNMSIAGLLVLAGTNAGFGARCFADGCSMQFGTAWATARFSLSVQFPNSVSSTPTAPTGALSSRLRILAGGFDEGGSEPCLTGCQYIENGCTMTPSTTSSDLASSTFPITGPGFDSGACGTTSAQVGNIDLFTEVSSSIGYNLFWCSSPSAEHLLACSCSPPQYSSVQWSPITNRLRTTALQVRREFAESWVLDPELWDEETSVVTVQADLGGSFAQHLRTAGPDLCFGSMELFSPGTPCAFSLAITFYVGNAVHSVETVGGYAVLGPGGYVARTGLFTDPTQDIAETDPYTNWVCGTPNGQVELRSSGVSQSGGPATAVFAVPSDSCTRVTVTGWYEVGSANLPKATPALWPITNPPSTPSGPGSIQPAGGTYDLNGDDAFDCDDKPLLPKTLPVATGDFLFPIKLDLNGDGTISLAEVEVFYAELPAACSCIGDIADDSGEPLPSAGINTGINEGDYTAFFAGYFDALPYCDIADDNGTPFPSEGVNTGVNEGDYNLFFERFFEGC